MEGILIGEMFFFMRFSFFMSLHVSCQTSEDLFEIWMLRWGCIVCLQTSQINDTKNGRKLFFRCPKIGRHVRTDHLVYLLSAALVAFVDPSSPVLVLVQRAEGVERTRRLLA